MSALQFKFRVEHRNARNKAVMINLVNAGVEVSGIYHIGWILPLFINVKIQILLSF
jgi:hypothetical protein